MLSQSTPSLTPSASIERTQRPRQGDELEVSIKSDFLNVIRRIESPTDERRRREPGRRPQLAPANRRLIELREARLDVAPVATLAAKTE
jgi:hypothetical protein